MRIPWQGLTLAAAFNLTVGIGVATAQTVMVRNAPPGSTIEVVLNTTTTGSAVADSTGGATLDADLAAHVGKAETDVHIYVDHCDELRRVLLVERALQPPPQEPGCDRRQILGLFLIRRISTLVVDVAGAEPSVLLRQGPFRIREPTVRSPAPVSLVLFGGGAFTQVRDAVALACGNVAACAGDSSGFGYTAGATYWFTRFLAAGASYIKPADVTVEGGEDFFRFTSLLDAHVVTITGKAGVPVGPVRLYGQIGTNYHRATSGTTQIMDDVTVTVDDIPHTIEGGTQSYELKTAGWGWVVGGGMEAWLRPAFALYAETGRAALKGSAMDAEGALDDRVTFILFGARVRIGR